MKKMHMFIGVGSFVLMVCLAGAEMTRAADQTVWQIGQFDQSSEEFGASFGIAPPSGVAADPVFRVGQSDWKKEWPAFHPGSANTAAGGREHPFTVIFSLSGRPRGVYTLTIATLPYMPRRPNLRIDINGKPGLFYLRPRISYDLGNFPVAFIPQYSFQQIEIDLPAAFFKEGENRLAVTCVDDPPEAEQAYGTVGSGISGIFYDALRLSHKPTKKSLTGEVSAVVSPTVFYSQKDGQSLEVIEAILRLNRKVPAGRAILDLNGKRYATNFSADSAFGEQRIEFEVPEWSGSTKATLRVEAGTSRHFELTLEPQRKWSVFVVPNTHLDIGYTDYQGKVAEGQARVLTQAADLIRQNPNFRFSLDASWNLEQLLLNRSKDKQDEILDMVRQGKLAVPVQYFNLLTGYASLEALIRSLYYSKALARQYGLPFEFANITDVPSYTVSYPSVLASAGVKYFAAAGNNWRAPFLLHGRWNEKSPFWWEGPDGQKVLFWYSRHYMQIQSLFGLPPSQAAGRDSLPVYLQAYSRAEYKPDAVMIFGAQAENTDLVPGVATFAEEWNRKYAYPRLRYATFGDFFKYIDQNYGSELQTYRGDGSPYWEDGIGSDAYFAAEDRRNQNRALSAEVLSTLTHTLDPSLRAPQNLVEDIWRNILLFAEHTWAAWLSISMPDHEQNLKQLEVKDNRATLARLEIDELVNRSMSQLADQIYVPSSTIVVFNSLNWRRSALVEIDLLSERATIRDLSTGHEIPYQMLSKKQGFMRVRFLAEDLPSVGYKCYAASYPESPAGTPPSPEVTRDPVVENTFYRITLDPASGAVASIYDKELQREIVDTHSPYKFGQYLYVTGGDGNTQIMRPVKTWPAPQLTVHPASGGEIVAVVKTPFGHSICLQSSAPNTPRVQTEILLFDKEKKIEFINRVEKQPVVTKEGVYFAFPAAVESPEFAYAPQTGWLNAARDLMKGASLEWFNVQYWMAVRDSQLAVGVVPVDAPLASFGDINRGSWPTEFKPKSSTLFSYVMNNYWDTNYRASQGGGTFRYVVTSNRSLEPQVLSRLGWNSLRPVEINYVMPQDKVGNPERPLPPEGASFLETDQPNVVLVTWKRAEDGQGSILRFYETAGRETAASLRFLRSKVRSAQLTNAVEDNLNPVPVSGDSLRLTFRPHEVLTVRIQ